LIARVAPWGALALVLWACAGDELVRMPISGAVALPAVTSVRVTALKRGAVVVVKRKEGLHGLPAESAGALRLAVSLPPEIDAVDVEALEQDGCVVARGRLSLEPPIDGSGAPLVLSALEPAACESPLARACAAHAEALCARWGACASDQFSLIFGAIADCERRERQLCTAIRSLPGAVAAIDLLLACASAVEAAGCEAVRNSVSYGHTVPGCSPVWSGGALPLGAACVSDHQCASFFCLPTVEGRRCGSCAARPATGESCATRRCEVGLVCDAADRCQPPRAAGDACGPGSPCGSPLACVTAPGRSDSTCVAPAQVGEACGARERGAPPCVDELYCSPVTQRCHRRAFADEGAPCGPEPDGGITDCRGLGRCEVSPGHVRGVCVRASALGEPCTPEARGCAASLSCARLPGDGQARCHAPTMALCAAER
jgi:hypothetical protein